MSINHKAVMCGWTAVQINVGNPQLRSILLSMTFSLSLTMVPGSAQADPSKVMNSIVSVLPEWANPQSRTKEPEGSGIVILDGSKIITARHVIKDALSVRIKTHDGRVLTAEVVGQDRLTDLAVLSITETLAPIGFGRDAVLGEQACAIGNAFGLGLSMTCGVVSAIHKTGVGFNPIEDFVQTDAAFNPGASGGALIAEDGRLLGVLSAIFTKDSDANIGVNFAVSAPLAQKVALALVRDKKVHWQFSGLKLKPAISRSGVGTLGAVVVDVRKDTPAQQAGLQTGDVILRLGKRRIKKPADFRSAFVSHLSELKLAIKIIRNKVEMVVEIHVPE